MRLIDADALLTDRRMRMYYHLPNGDIAVPVIDIEHAPTIEERKTGKWVDNNELKQFFCDQCGKPSLTYDDVYIYSMDLPNFCDECGADMRGNTDDKK